jgi:hypothetical protein
VRSGSCSEWREGWQAFIWFGRSEDCERSEEKFRGEICCCFPCRVRTFQGLVVWICIACHGVVLKSFVHGVACRILCELVVRAWGSLVATGGVPVRARLSEAV